MHGLAVRQRNDPKIPGQFRDEHPKPDPTVRLDLAMYGLREGTITPFSAQVSPLPEHLLFEVPRGFHVRRLDRR